MGSGVIRKYSYELISLWCEKKEKKKKKIAPFLRRLDQSYLRMAKVVVGGRYFGLQKFGIRRRRRIVLK